MKQIVAFTGLLILLYQTGCKPKEKTEEKKDEVKYIATTPVMIDTSFEKQYVSQIRSVRNIEIRAQGKGFLEAVYVDEGRYVKAGQLLFRIMPKLYEAELQKAEASVRAEEVELENTKALVAKNIVSKNEQALAQAKVDQARAEVALAKLHLSFTEIRAPFDGIIDRLPKKLGSLIDEGDLLTSLSDNSQMFAYFNVSEPEYLDYETNIKNRGSSKVKLRLANGKIMSVKGDVETVESEFDSETGNIAFRARFDNPGKLLRNGETGTILMTMPFHNALVIPQKATYELQDKTYVFVIDDKNQVHSRLVHIAGRLPDLYIIDNGLVPGDKILLEGVQKVKDDDKIQYILKKGEEILPTLRTKAE